MSSLLPFAHAWLWLGLAVSTSVASQAAPAASTTTTADALRGTYGNHGLWLTRGQVDGADAAASDAVVAQLRQDLRVEKADYVIVDLRGGGDDASGDLDQAIAGQLWGSTSEPRRLKADARVFVIADDRCTSKACRANVNRWKALGARELDLPSTVRDQDGVAVEAWVQAAADNAGSNDKVAASTP